MMNRWLAGFIALIVISIIAIYSIIPSHLVVTKIVLSDCNRDGAARVLGDTVGWAKWWPSKESGGSLTNGGKLVLHDICYSVSARLLRGAAVTIDQGSSEFSSVLNIFPLQTVDSSYLQWQVVRDVGWNPLKRIARYREAVKLKDDMAVILGCLRDYLHNPRNIYGIDIIEGPTKDSSLLETLHTMREYPGTVVIYGLVRRLRQFASRHGGVQTGDPMVNVESLADGQFSVRTAIPVSKECADSGDIVFRKLVRGKYLQSDVRGGQNSINSALARMKEYIADNKRTVMAIPFFSLITNRTEETDTARWLTRIYYPIY